MYDCRTEKGKKHFLKDMKKFEGIELTPEEMRYNDTLRSEAKLAMNSYELFYENLLIFKILKLSYVIEVMANLLNPFFAITIRSNMLRIRIDYEK